MQLLIELPKAFSMRDDNELAIVRDLVARLNPKLAVTEIATGMHVDGGATVNWGLVYLNDQPPNERAVQAALVEAGLDFGVLAGICG